MARHTRAEPRGRGWRGAAAMIALALLACGPGAEDRNGAGATDQREQRTGSAESSPFTAGPAPEDYKPVVAGTGTEGGQWSEDSTGTDEPYTVLARGGDPAGADVVVVSITGFEGYEGGIGQASARYGSEDVESFTVDGNDARYAPAATHDEIGELWADLVAVRGDDLAVRVTAPDATRDELVEILERVEAGSDHTRAPSVVDPPNGLKVIGSVDVQGLVAGQTQASPGSASVPGPASAHSAGWVAPGPTVDRQVVVQTLPGQSLDPEALPYIYRGRFRRKVASHEREVGGRPATVVEWTDGDEGFGGRSVWVESAWGDIVVVSASGEPPPSEDELVALAASVRPTDEAGWETFVVEMTGGPGLHPDEGRTELARGQAGDVEWLLQNGPPQSAMLNDPGVAPGSLRAVDPCLKLSTRERACASTGGGSTDEWIRSTTGTEEFPAFVVVSTTRAGTSLDVTTAAAEITVPLVPVPGGGLWGAVAIVEGAGTAICQEPADTPRPESIEPVRIDLLDAQGAVVGCLGLGA